MIVVTCKQTPHIYLQKYIHILHVYTLKFVTILYILNSTISPTDASTGLQTELIFAAAVVFSLLCSVVCLLLYTYWSWRRTMSESLLAHVIMYVFHKWEMFTKAALFLLCALLPLVLNRKRKQRDDW